MINQLAAFKKPPKGPMFFLLLHSLGFPENGSYLTELVSRTSVGAVKELHVVLDVLQLNHNYSLPSGDMSCRHSHENNVCKHNGCSYNCVQREPTESGDCLGRSRYALPEYA